MKKQFGFLSFTMVLVFLLISFAGCATDADKKNEFTYDMLLEYSYSNVGVVDRKMFNSLKEYKESLSASGEQGVLGAVKCKKVTYYITLDHWDNGVQYISGKSVAECELVSVAERIGTSDIKSGETLEIVQEVYLIPKNDEDLEEMLKSFGAVINKDENGNTVGMKIADGDYELKHQDGIEYVLNVFDYELPMEAGQTYTAMLRFNGKYWYADCLLPANNIDRYKPFLQGDVDLAIAEEVKQLVTAADESAKKDNRE